MGNRVPAFFNFKIILSFDDLIWFQTMPKKEDFGYTLVRGKDKVLQKFKKILLCCPSFVVANSKKQRGSNNLFSRDPIANEFIKLDNEIKIDKDYKD